MSCEVVGSAALARATMHCREGRELSGGAAEELVAILADEGVGDGAKAEFLLAWAEKGETGAELAGMARAFLGRAKPAGLTGKWGGEGIGRLLWDGGRGETDREYIYSGRDGGGGGGFACSETWESGDHPTEWECGCFECAGGEERQGCGRVGQLSG